MNKLIDLTDHRMKPDIPKAEDLALDFDNIPEELKAKLRQIFTEAGQKFADALEKDFIEAYLNDS
ncbi:hypothetical protein LCGC14_1700670 [marine sediment metagenome]|uniref:Uncharacterized protein n=1 Tax=marine sediment metagenome TaxID=412755 RepID=A0A0F9KI21_9ZZZZ